MENQDAKLLDMIRSIHHPGVEDAEGTVTTPELAKIMDCSRDKALRTIHELVEAGKLEPAKVTRNNIQGIPQPRAGYRVVQEDE